MGVEGPIHLSQNKSKGMLNGLRENEKTGQTDMFFILCVMGVGSSATPRPVLLFWSCLRREGC